jgi:signal peptidase II
LKGRLEIVLIALLLLADQGSKAFVQANMPYHESVAVLPFLAVHLTYNEGIAFSLFSFLGDKALIAVTVAIMVFVVWLWRQAHVSRVWARVGFTLVFGGALGNLIDRLVHGHVVDFILFHMPEWSFAIFNLADSFITVGAALILFDEFVVLRGGAEEEADNGDGRDGNA